MRLRHYITFTACLLLLPLSAGAVDFHEYEKTKYPMIIVHGFIERSDIIYPNSALPIANFLNKKGMSAYIADIDALGSIESNAERLAKQIEKICLETETEKVNIIAFSKGGLDSRLAAYLPQARGRIASITTVSTPHRGTPVADFFSSNPLTTSYSLEYIMNTLAGYAGDRNQDFIKTITQLGTEEMEIFNTKYQNLDEVTYYSFSAVMRYDDFHFIFSLLREYIFFKEGPNDGMISVSSARWGNYLGTVNEYMEYSGSLNHPDLVGLDILPNSDFDYLDFYFRVVQMLIKNGY